jgi:hypothetical protein
MASSARRYFSVSNLFLGIHRRTSVNPTISSSGFVRGAPRINLEQKKEREGADADDPAGGEGGRGHGALAENHYLRIGE